MSLLSISDLSITYRTAHGEVEAVSGIELEVNPGEMLSLIHI